MKEVERKDLPGISGGEAGTTPNNVALPSPLPIAYPTPTDPTDPLGDGKLKPV
jgi:hypothetical protein